MAKSKRDRKIQKKLQFADASITSPPYEAVPLASNTKKNMRKTHNNNKCTGSNICQCDDHYQFRTWQSPDELYKDTKEIYDSNDEKPVQFYKLQNSNDKERKKNYTYKTGRRKSQSIHSKINKYVKKSRSINRKGSKVKENYLEHDSNSKKATQPNIHIKVEKKSKLKNKNLSKNRQDTGDSCVGGPCEKFLSHYDLPQEDKELTKIKNNNIKVKKKVDGRNIETKYKKEGDLKAQGDQAASKNFEKVKSKSFINSFINKIKCCTHKDINKNNNNVFVKQEPLFEIKVDSTEMQILNSTDIKNKVNQFGTLHQKECICPSRMTALKSVCDGGVCGQAQQKGTRFSCKCHKQNNIHCKDTTCDNNIITKLYKKDKQLKSSNYTNGNNPLFEMRLDSNMAVLNSHEIQDVFRNSGRQTICPTGICSTSAKKGNMQINCKCLNKKIIRKIMECTSHTCQLDKNRKDTYLNKLSTPQQGKQGDLYCKCFCECDEENLEAKKALKKKSSDKKNKSKKRQKSKLKKSRRFKRKGPLTTKEQFEKCFKNECANCEKRLRKKEHQYKENEKKIKKMYLKEDKMIKKVQKNDDQNWNCLTSLVSGVLNLLLQTVKKIFTAIFSLVTNPIGSYVYIRERGKDPPGTLNRIARWFIRTWTNKTSKLSQKVKETEAMNVIADQIEDSALYESLFANKGRTKKEKAAFARKSRLRKKRIRKRQDEALYGCRHMLLTTLRKTPCLWFYHICPDLYPQCLGLTTFMKNFYHLILFILAFLCWTPCILSFELCRAFLCCIFCTG